MFCQKENKMKKICLKEVKRVYQAGSEKVQALKGITFEILEQEFCVILGPSGSGKSTLLNILGGMDRASSGVVHIGDVDISHFSNSELTDYRRLEIGFVFQFYNLIPTLKVYENVDMAARLGNNPLDAKEVLRAVGLEKRMDHFPAELSGGELQRVSIARALVKNPKILLCDEPTGALDSDTGKKILCLLQDMAQRYGKTVIVVTHNAAIAPAADRVIHLKDGEIQRIEENTIPMNMSEVIW